MIDFLVAFLAIFGILSICVVVCIVWIFWGIFNGPQYDDEDLKETLWEKKDG